MKDKKGPKFFRSPSAPTSPRKLIKGNTHSRKLRYASDVTDKMPFASSGTNSSSSLQSTSSAGAIGFKGVLHCIWKCGLPFFVFSWGDQGEVYVADLYEDSSNDNTRNYMYSFYSRTDEQPGIGPSGDNVSDIVGKMKVLSSSTLDSNNLKLVETEFVLFGATEDSFLMMQSRNTSARNNKGLPEKMVDVFRTSSYKQRSTLKSGDQSSMLVFFSQEPCLDAYSKCDELVKDSFLENHLAPNLELAAIVVKEYHHDNSQVIANGGWGLKFLDNVPSECVDNLLNSSSENCQCSDINKKNTLVNMNVIVPAGFHGGAINSNCAPSRLIDRWRSGGHCDCGGWDTGCPLTVLNSRKSNTESLPQTERQEHCKSFDLFIQGSKLGVPTLKMVNMHEGLYFVYFQSPLSALQSFSMGVAIIHTRTPSLHPKL